MTETTDFTATPEGTAGETTDESSSPARGRRRTGTLSGLVLPQLQQVAQQLGITGIARMRKSQLIEAIEAAQGGGSTARAASQAQPAAKRTRRQVTAIRSDEPVAANGQSDATPATENGQSTDSEPKAAKAVKAAAKVDSKTGSKADGAKTESKSDSAKNEPKSDAAKASPDFKSEPARSDQAEGDTARGDQEGREPSGRRDSRDNRRDNGNRDNKDNSNKDNSKDGRNSNRQDQSQRDNNRDSRDNRDDDSADGRGRRRRRSRDRFRERGSGSGGSSSGGGSSNRRDRYDPEPQLSEDDVLIPVAGILDVLDNYAFVRTSGFLPGSNDVYVSLAMVKKYGLRKGDAVSGVIRQPRDGERREKFNPLVRVDTVNGADPEVSKQRPEFSKLTPLYPQDRLRLETEASNLTGRVIDLVSPIGKGQRGMIVSPSKAGKTLIMQSIANSITTNNPEVHLMVVLVDERPEEVTDFQRAVKGEVIASTFDRPADDHTTVAELAIERAKRLVELGHDVVVLLDGITRLGRAYNLAAPASGRILSGGVDSSALYPPKKFFGAARNIENGGSLTILATALVETGSKMDEVIFEEFKGTGNMEVRLKRDFADKRIFPAIDVDASSTRREELLMSRDELAIVWKLRRVLGGLDGLQSLELLLDKLKQTKSNVEFLMQINKTMPSVGGSSSRDDD